MQTDYTATFYRDDGTLEVSDGHDNVVTTIRCEEWQIPDRMRDEFGHLALYIPVELRDNENVADDDYYTYPANQRQYNIAHHIPSDP